LISHHHIFSLKGPVPILNHCYQSLQQEQSTFLKTDCKKYITRRVQLGLV